MVFVLVLGYSFPAQAYDRPYDYIDKVKVGEDSHLYISVKGKFSEDHGCSDTTYASSKYPMPDERTKAWMQIAVSSLTNREEVRVWTEGCTTLGLPILKGIEIQQD